MAYLFTLAIETYKQSTIHIKVNIPITWMVGQLLPLLGEVDALLRSEEAKVENLSNLELQLKGGEILRIENMTTQLVIYIFIFWLIY